MAYKLVVSNKVAFKVAFSINADGKDHDFGMRLEAERMPHDTLVQEGRSPEFANRPLVAYLRERVGLRMVGWVEDKSPLKDADTDAFVAAGDAALEALPELVSNIAGLIYAGYVAAITAKGKAGN
jgi:hypothetical protein